MMGSDVNAVVILVIVVFLVVLAILWFFLPFAIFGTKDKLDEIIAQNKEINRLLKIITEDKKQISGDFDDIKIKT